MDILEATALFHHSGKDNLGRITGGAKLRRQKPDGLCLSQSSVLPQDRNSQEEDGDPVVGEASEPRFTSEGHIHGAPAVATTLVQRYKVTRKQQKSPERRVYAHSLFFPGMMMATMTTTTMGAGAWAGRRASPGQVQGALNLTCRF